MTEIFERKILHNAFWKVHSWDFNKHEFDKKDVRGDCNIRMIMMYVTITVIQADYGP